MRFLVPVVIALAACGSGQNGGSSDRVWWQDQAVCVGEADTVNIGGQGPPARPIGSCRTWPDSRLAMPAVQGKCGPCGFVLDETATHSARIKRNDACCYSVSSPPPPPPPPSP